MDYKTQSYQEITISVPYVTNTAALNEMITKEKAYEPSRDFLGFRSYRFKEYEYLIQAEGMVVSFTKDKNFLRLALFRNKSNSPKYLLLKQVDFTDFKNPISFNYEDKESTMKLSCLVKGWKSLFSFFFLFHWP